MPSVQTLFLRKLRRLIRRRVGGVVKYYAKRGLRLNVKRETGSCFAISPTLYKHKAYFHSWVKIKQSFRVEAIAPNKSPKRVKVLCHFFLVCIHWISTWSTRIDIRWRQTNRKKVATLWYSLWTLACLSFYEKNKNKTHTYRDLSAHSSYGDRCVNSPFRTTDPFCTTNTLPTQHKQTKLLQRHNKTQSIYTWLENTARASFWCSFSADARTFALLVGVGLSGS